MMKTIFKKITNLNRISKQLIMLIFDFILLIIILICSFSLSQNSLYFPSEDLYWIIFGAPIIAIPIFIFFGLYRSVIRYIGFKSFSSIIQAVTLYSLTWGLISLMANHPLLVNLLGNYNDPFVGGYFEGISRSVILINWMIALILIGGSRLLARWIFSDTNIFSTDKKNNVIIYGAGEEGRQLSQALQNSIQFNHVAFIDDDLNKAKSFINNIPVFSNIAIDDLIRENKVSEIFLALTSISRKQRRQIIEKLSLQSVQVKSIPSVSELAEGKVKIDDLLEIDVRDVLGRDQVKPNEHLIKVNIRNKVVLVTGAGGSIGSELCRQILGLKPKRLILYESSEPSLYQIEQELFKMNKLKVEILPILGTINDSIRMEQIFSEFNVQTIYHAAAYKHVPLVEYNPSQGVINNTIGTLHAAQAAISKKVETFVLISTDKAVRPTSTMGATKRAAELVLQALAQTTNSTILTMVRFGNVLDSSGSVIPLFKKQIKEGGPITVTDLNMVRYFMTIPEAVELVIQAGAMSSGGDVFVLDMGDPVSINDLAKKMIQLSGLQLLDKNNPQGDIEIIYTGLRPGEKLYEELISGDNINETEHELIMSAKEEMIDWEILEPILKELNEASNNLEINKMRELLITIVPDFGLQKFNKN